MHCKVILRYPYPLSPCTFLWPPVSRSPAAGTLTSTLTSAHLTFPVLTAGCAVQACTKSCGWNQKVLRQPLRSRSVCPRWTLVWHSNRKCMGARQCPVTGHGRGITLHAYTLCTVSRSCCCCRLGTLALTLSAACRYDARIQKNARREVSIKVPAAQTLRNQQTGKTRR